MDQAEGASESVPHARGDHPITTGVTLRDRLMASRDSIVQRGLLSCGWPRTNDPLDCVEQLLQIEWLR